MHQNPTLFLNANDLWIWTEILAYYIFLLYLIFKN